MEAAGFVYRAGHCESWSFLLRAAIGSPYFPSLFLASSIQLSFAGLGAVKSKWDLCVVS